MTILQLSYLSELAKIQSFSLAAQQLHISQPALSMQIAKLEEELEVKLFHRSPTKVALTNEGEKFLERVREVLQLFDRLKDFPLELEHQPTGRLRIGVIPTLAPYWMPLFVDGFAKEYPEVKVTITEMVTRDIIESLKEGVIEAGFLSTPIEATGIDFKPLFYERFFIYVSDKHLLSQKHEISLRDVDMEEIWYLEEGNCFQNQINSVCAIRKEPDEKQKIIYRSNSIESLCKIVEHGKGMTFIPELATMAVSADQEELIKPIASPAPFREISLAMAHHQQHNSLVDLFVRAGLKPIPARMKNPTSGIPVDTQLVFK